MNKQSIEILTGINNQLCDTERQELFEKVIELISKKELESIMRYCTNNFTSETKISIDENGGCEL